MLRRGGLLGILAICFAIAVPAVAAAATVSNTNDSGPGSLRQAILSASPGETISVPAGDYKLTSGEITIEKSLTITGAGAGATTIEGGSSRTFHLEGEETSVTISGLTLRGTQLNTGIVDGGVIYSVFASLTLSDVVLTEVSAITPGGIVDGGAIFADEGKLAILDSKISHINASAAGASGHNGGIIDGGAIYLAGTKLTMERSSITDVSVDVRGGQGPSSSSQNGGIADGGGISASGPAPGSSIVSSTIGRISIDAGPGPGGPGGIADGGGLFLEGGEGDFALTADTIADDSAEAGTGIADGGGAYLEPIAPGTIQVLASTIASNRSGSGGGVLVGSGVRFRDSIVAGNSGVPKEQNCGLETTEVTGLSGGFNLDSGDECGFHAAGDRVNANPQLGPLQDNGGPTQTMLPAASSPVVDQGSAPGSAADQRGAPRPIDFPSIANAAGGDGSDIGAVEVQASNAFSFGTVTRNKKKGTATLAINLPVPPNAGTLTLSSPGLKSQTLALTGSATSVSFPLVATGGALKALKKKGKRAVAITVSLQPPGTTASTQSLTTKLFKKLKKKHHKHRRHKKNAKHGAHNKKHHR
jgi:hypothetical protein